MTALRVDPPPPAAGVHVADSVSGDPARPERYTLVGPDRRSYVSDRPGTLGGHRGTRIYGSLNCPAALRAIARGGYVSERVFFANEAIAIAAGYRPCAVCCPERYRVWKAARDIRRVIDAVKHSGPT